MEAIIENDSVVLTWNAVEGATYYSLYQSEKFLGSTGQLTQKLGLEVVGIYCFTVTAANLAGESEHSEEVCVTTLSGEGDDNEDPENPGGNEPETPGDEPETPGDEPETPADSVVLAAPVVVVDTVTETTVTLVWNVVENATNYNVYMDSALVASVADTTYTADSLTAETTYSFTVTAVADTLESVASNVVTVTTLKAEEPGGDEPTDPEQPEDPEQPGEDDETCTITAVANPEEAGTISGAGTYLKDMTVTLTATANEGYKFVNWTENDVIVSTDAEYSFVIAKDRNLVANFELINEEKTYNVTAVANPEEAGTIIGAGTYLKDMTVTLTATANEGYKFVNWTENGVIISTDAEYSFVITKDRDLVANFISTAGIVENAAAFSIYPNPAVDRVVIATESTIESVSIYTLTGVMIYSEVDFNNNTINVSDFASGVYFIKVRTDNGESVQRFIKK